jgi:hypothetical protein
MPLYVNRRRYEWQEEFLALALTAFSALEEAELNMMGQIQERVFERDFGSDGSPDEAHE